LPAERQLRVVPPTAPTGRTTMNRWRSTTTSQPVQPAQRQAEDLGTPTHAQLSLLLTTTDTMLLPKALERRSQLIAVTCIAEHA